MDRKAFSALWVPGMGFEPTRLAAHDSESCLSTNFNIQVFGGAKIVKIQELSALSHEALCRLALS
jgi:hypothetical protein